MNAPFAVSPRHHQRNSYCNDGSFLSSPSTPLRRYFSRRQTLRLSTNDLPLEKSAKGVYTAVGLSFVVIKLTVPFAYVYISLILLRELCARFPDTIFGPVQRYLPPLASVVNSMQRSSKLVELWVVIEALFYICLCLHIQWLQYKDPLEASLSAAPMLELHERLELWNRMMDSVMDDPVSFVSGWFFDQNLESISKYDMLDFLAWSMYEGRNQEHLTHQEMTQLNDFVNELEWRISIYLHGTVVHSVKGEITATDDVLFAGDRSVGDRTEEDRRIQKENSRTSIRLDTPLNLSDSFSDHYTLRWHRASKQRAEPQKSFSFQESSHDEQSSLFTNLYENYRNTYEQYKNKLESAEFHPVQNFRDYMAEKRQQIYEAEEHALATAGQMYETAYFTFVDKGSTVDKQLTALGHATHAQLTEAWNSVVNMKERLETANFIATRRKALHQQLKGYRMLLDRMRAMSTVVPTKQMADLMRKITQCNESLEIVENSAMNAFIKATGYARKNFLPRKEPQRYAKYSSDPLLGLATYPLLFHLLILGATDGTLRILMRNRGFQRLKIGPTSYYFYPGTNGPAINEDGDEEEVPIVFCHGIGIGLVVYIPLVDELMKSGRPILLPEIPNVCGFRPWQSPSSILTPAAVSSTLTAMLASHGYLRAAFIGHSYGTSWLSYMCKFAPSAIAGIVFLDPICFCLHMPSLTKQFVYHRADPGAISYMIRTDVIVNWTIQRSFPWARISLFTEQIPNVPCAVFLSDMDALVPAAKAESYLRSKGAPVMDFETADEAHFIKGPINLTVFRGDGHGDWTERPCASRKIATAVFALFNQNQN